MPKYVWLLAIATTINVTGASFLWPLNTIYIHNELGRSLAFAGLIVMLNQGASIIGNMIGGILFDKLSAYKTIMIGMSLAFMASATMSVYHTIVPYSILLVLIGFGSGMSKPVMFAMAGSVWPEGGRRAFNAIYVAQNFGVALGATIGGYIASYSFNYIFIANATLFAAFLVLVLTTFKGMDKERDRQMHATVIGQGIEIKSKSAFNALLVLCVGFLICWIAYSQWQSTIASYTQDLGIPLERYSLLWAINGSLIVLGQPFLKIITDRVTSTKKQIYIGISIMVISFSVTMFAEVFTLFAVSMAILTIGEMIVWPAIPTLANELAPKGRVGFYQGIVNSVSAAGRMIGPLLGGLIVDFYNIQLLFFILLILFIIPYFTTHFYDRWLTKSK